MYIFLSILLTKFVTCIALGFIIMNFYYKVVTCNSHDKFLLAKSTKKNVLRGVNSTNLKTSSGYIAKSKSQGICLQLTQTPGNDYVIWPLFNGKFALQCSFKATSCSSLEAISRMPSDFIFKGCGFGDASTKKNLPRRNRIL
jgi:hypothetical protein